MKIFLFILIPILVVTAYALYQWFRNRQPSSVESGIDAFRREMSALSPERAPVNRRPERPRPADPEPSSTVSISDGRQPERSPAPEQGRTGPRRPGDAGEGER